MEKKRLNPVDLSWLVTDSRVTPNHVGGLLVFQLPEDAPRDYLRTMLTDFRAHNRFTAPWNLKLKSAVTINPLATWVQTEDIDLEYHIRHAALPWPGGERELGELVGRLQSTPIDLTRPPWECTLIEGLEDNRFGLFIKMHHALIDGVSGMKLLQKAMSASQKASLQQAPFWDQGASVNPARERRERPEPSIAQATAMAMKALNLSVETLPHLASAFGKIVRRIGDPSEGLAVPFNTPQSLFNGRVHGKRRFATQQVPLERMRAVCEASGATLNDVVLTLCGTALRRFLLERDALPDKPLTAGIPISVRPSDDDGTGNAISFIVATMGTDIEDARLRLQTVQASAHEAKAHVQSLPRLAMTQYTMLLMAPTILALLLGMGGRTPPMFNMTISNVPGPAKPLYFMGAQLLAVYPASIVTHGQAMNITCQSYNGQMNFGFTACHASVPSVQRIAVYLGEAMDELEQAFRPRKAAPAKKTATAKKTTPAKQAAPAQKAAPRKRAPRKPAEAAPTENP
ncbi:WS/DGAT/MGAT family O-acyltransferase [Comamonas badia]|uniref:WS/DGAT/MGAT family O-acyltransferase n=1 Tax=Comamonas badia TaxID=265291 RepID=UPI0004078478|nr:wax ester/triacylglycerol synthase family O-acyltransferase [Comamonas badia]